MEDKQVFSTGATRNKSSGRGMFELLPARTIRLLAEHFEKGCEEHGSRNWEKGINLSRILQSALRHSFDFLEGKDDKYIHAISAMWNWSILIETSERIKSGFLPKELDDLSSIPSWQEPKYLNNDLKEFNKAQEARNLEEDRISNQDIPNSAAQDELLKRVDEELGSKTIEKVKDIDFSIANRQVLSWYTFEEKTPDNNRELLLEYNQTELKKFSPHFPIARYCIGFANSCDKSLFSRWSYLSDKKNNVDVHPTPKLVYATKHVLPPKRENYYDPYYRWRLMAEGIPNPCLYVDENNCRPYDIEVSYNQKEIRIIKSDCINVFNEFKWWRYIKNEK